MTTTTNEHDARHRANLADFAALRRGILSGDNVAAAAAIDRLRDADVPTKELEAALTDSVKHAAAYQLAAEPRAAVTEAADAQARRPGPWSPAAEHAEAAESYCEHHSGTSLDARAITHALLYLGAVIEGAAERLSDDVDTAAAMVDDRLTSIEAVIDPAVVVTPLWWRHVAFRVRYGRARQAGAGQ
jgi:hypothetical protein